MEQFYINHCAVLVCALANLALGAIWYSPLLFYKPWMKENNFTEDDLKKNNPAKTYGITLFFPFLLSWRQ
jgi:hypothetical protein